MAAEAPVTVLYLNVKQILTMCPSACTQHSRVIRNFLGKFVVIKNLRFSEKLTHTRHCGCKLMVAGT